MIAEGPVRKYLMSDFRNIIKKELGHLFPQDEVDEEEEEWGHK